MSYENSAAPQASGAAKNHAPIIPLGSEGNTHDTASAASPARGMTPEQHTAIHAIADRCAAEAKAAKAKLAHYAPDVNEGREWDANRQDAMRRCEPLPDGTRDPYVRDMLAISRRGWAA